MVKCNGKANIVSCVDREQFVIDEVLVQGIQASTEIENTSQVCGRISNVAKGINVTLQVTIGIKRIFTESRKEIIIRGNIQRLQDNTTEHVIVRDRDES